MEAIANRAGELLRSRASFVLDEDECLIWFGVGRATLERIGAGEVEPEADVLERIDRFLMLCGRTNPVGPSSNIAGGTAILPATGRGSPSSRGLPGPSFTHGDRPTGGGDANARNDRCADRATVSAANLGEASSGGPIRPTEARG